MQYIVISHHSSGGDSINQTGELLNVYTTQSTCLAYINKTNNKLVSDQWTRALYDKGWTAIHTRPTYYHYYSDILYYTRILLAHA